MDPYAYIVFGRGLSRALTKLRLGPAIPVTSPIFKTLNVSPDEGGLSEIYAPYTNTFSVIHIATTGDLFEQMSGPIKVRMYSPG